MSTTAVSNINTTTTSNTSTTSASAKNAIDKNTFLKLFCTQLQYQDPLNPMDAAAFTTQLAQFSSLEQLTNVNTNLSNLTTAQNSLLLGTSASLIGKTVTLKDGSSGTVNGVSFDGSNTQLTLDNNTTVSFSNITKISS